MPDLSYLPQIALAGIAVGCIYGLIGIGFCVIYNASGIVNFAQGAFVMMGGMIAYSALTALGLPLPVAAVVAIAAVAAVGVIIERVVVRPLWDRKATMFVMILATLAAQIVVERLALIVAGDQPRTLPLFSDLPPIRLGAVVVNYQFLWIVGISLLADRSARPILQADQDRQGDASLRLQPRGGVAPGHQRLANAVAVVCAVCGAWAPSRACSSRRRNTPPSTSACRLRSPALSRPSSAVSATRSVPSWAASCWGWHNLSPSSHSARG